MACERHTLSDLPYVALSKRRLRRCKRLWVLGSSTDLPIHLSSCGAWGRHRRDEGDDHSLVLLPANSSSPAPIVTVVDRTALPAVIRASRSERRDKLVLQCTLPLSPFPSRMPQECAYVCVCVRTHTHTKGKDRHQDPPLFAPGSASSNSSSDKNDTRHRCFSCAAAHSSKERCMAHRGTIYRDAYSIRLDAPSRGCTAQWEQGRQTRKPTNKKDRHQPAEAMLFGPTTRACSVAV